MICFQPLEYLADHSLYRRKAQIMTMKDTTGTIVYSAGVTPLMPPNDNISLSGEIVFGGYGYMNSEEKYNDFAGISVNDRIVIR
ncbi:MAG: hypothetical protein U5L72_09855 [Bacteroidales bacterium]|nr:hypothetical protein [Bacteroidales bacterium]